MPALLASKWRCNAPPRRSKTQGKDDKEGDPPFSSFETQLKDKEGGAPLPPHVKNLPKKSGEGVILPFHVEDDRGGARPSTSGCHNTKTK